MTFQQSFAQTIAEKDCLFKHSNQQFFYFSYLLINVDIHFKLTLIVDNTFINRFY